MAGLKVNISPDLLDWVINTTSIGSLESKIQDSLLKWQSGEKKPTFAQVQKLSTATHIPLGYFFLNRPPAEDFSVLKYRTLDSKSKKKSSRELLDIIAQMEVIQDWMKSFLIREGRERLPFVNSASARSNILGRASKIRTTIGIDVDWAIRPSRADQFKLIKQALSNAGILVMSNGIVGMNTHRTLDVEEFRAFALIDEYAPLIFINTNDSKGGKLFSLLHEAAHIWTGVDNIYNDRLYFANSNDKTEQFCNAVAAELLVPNEVFCAKWTNTTIKTSKSDLIQSLANMFGCSMIVIARRALDNKYITSEQYNQMARKSVIIFENEKKKEKSSGGDFYASNALRLDHNFISALHSSVQEGKTLSTDAYRLTNTTRKTFPALVDRILGRDGYE
jgi:Zn-dependent peptidase ImmA (M78 family)